MMTLKVTENEEKIVIEHGYNAIMILDHKEAERLVDLIEAIIFDEKESHKYLSDRNGYLETINEQLEHENIRMMEEIELCN